MRTSTRKLTTISTAFALVVGATFTLSGCLSSPLDGLTQNGTNGTGGSSNGTGANSNAAGDTADGNTGTDDNNSDDSNAYSSADGGFSYGKIPEHFPSQVPVVDGEITGSLYGPTDDGTVWSMSIRTNDPSAFEKLRSQLNSTGFTEDDVMEGDTTMGWWQGHGYDVFITSSKMDGAINIAYIVTESEE